MTYTIEYGTTKLRFTLDRRERKTLGVHVYPDLHVEVVAPIEASTETVIEKVKKRAPWIARQQRYFSRIPTPQPQPLVQSGETFRYLGRQYRLRIVEGTSNHTSLRNGRLVLTVRSDAGENKRRKLLEDWYRGRASRVFGERVRACTAALSTSWAIEIPDWRLRTMPKRWGSCTKAGVIHLNPRLVAAPKACIDYVVYHELCHLREHSHSPRFYELLTRVYPDWKKWRDYLNEHIEVRLV